MKLLKIKTPILILALLIGVLACKSSTETNQQKARKAYGNWEPNEGPGYYWAGNRDNSNPKIQAKSLHNDTTDSAGYQIIEFSQPDSTWLEIKSAARYDEFHLHYIDSTINDTKYGEVLDNKGGFWVKTPFTDDSLYASTIKTRVERTTIKVTNRMICDSTYNLENEKIDIRFELQHITPPPSDTIYNIKNIYRFDASGMRDAAVEMMCQ